jgi:hypothetical protein
MTRLCAIVRGSLGFAIVSVAAFSVWAFGKGWLRDYGGETTLYACCFAVFAALTGLLLHPLVTGAGALRRFYLSFVPAFLAYTVLWCAAWYALGADSGEWLGSLAGSIGFAAVLAMKFRRFGAMIPAALALFTGHSAGYFAGEWICYDQLHSVPGELAWGLLYGLGFGAGIGYAYWAVQREGR